jgi:hypothetical protein
MSIGPFFLMSTVAIMSEILSKMMNWLLRGLCLTKPRAQPCAHVVAPVQFVQPLKSIGELHPIAEQQVVIVPTVVDGDHVEIIPEMIMALKPVKLTKKQSKEKHLLDPGWDMSVEREAVINWLRTKPEWLERYRRVRNVRPTNYVIKSPEYQTWSTEFSDWCSFLIETVERQARRKFGADLLGLNSDLISRIITKEFDRVLDDESFCKRVAENNILQENAAITGNASQDESDIGIVKSSRLIQDGMGLIYKEDMDPYEYEHFCARLLRAEKWKAEATKGSGDQGVDVLAEKFGFKVAIQVKKYAAPAGNGAVQEILAGMLFYDAKFAVVVCAAGFTRSAKALAEKTGVHLMHHDDLRNLETILPSNSYFSQASYNARKSLR